MNEVYGICINRNLILSRSLFSFFFPLHSAPLPYSFYRIRFLLLLSLSALPPCLTLYPAFSNFLGSSLLPSDEMYKAVERRMPLKSRLSVRFLPRHRIRNLALSLFFLICFFSASHTTVVFSLPHTYSIFFVLLSVSVLSSLCIQFFHASSPAREHIYLVNARM